MAGRKPYDPSARLNLLRPVLAELADHEMVNAERMAKIARMTWENLKIIIEGDPEFPVESRGGMGIAWSFRAKAVISYLVAGYQAQLDQKNRVSARVAVLSGLAPEQQANGVATSMSSLEMKQTAEAMTAAFRLKVLQGEYVKWAACRDLFNELFGTLNAETMAFIGSYDPAGLLTPAQREAIMDHQRRLLVMLQDAVMTKIDGLGERRRAA